MIEIISQPQKKNTDELEQRKKVNNNAYEEFLRIFTTLYDKICPIAQYCRKLKFAECPWISKGLHNVCKKENILYRDFIRLKTEETENRYKDK